MKFKRILTSLLSITILLSGVALALAENAPKLSDKVEEAHIVLSNIGFVSSDFTKEMVAEMGDVTRGEFAELIYQSFGKGMVSENVYFHDVPRTHYAAQAISVLVENGALSVNAEKRFEPDRAITKTEAAKIILYTIGYKGLVESTGAYPAGVDNVATQLDLYDGINLAETVGYGDALVMIYNGLLCEYMEPKTAGYGGYVYEGTGETYGEKFYGLKVNEGLVTSFDGVSIYGDSVNENILVIDGVEINAGNRDMSDFLGHKVKFVTREIDEEDVLIYIKKDERQDCLELNTIDHLFEYESNSFEYYDGNKKKTETLTQNFTVIYNGGYLGSDITEALKEDIYSVKLIETKNSGYDLVIVSSYDSGILSAIDSENEKLYVKVDGVYKTIDLNTYKDVYITDTSGEELAIDGITRGSILNIVETKDKNKVKIVVSNDTISGTVESIDDVQGRASYKIDGNLYYAYKKGVKMNCELGQNITAYLDMNGLIVDVKGLENEASFGFVKNIFNDEDSDRTVLKIYGANGAFISLPVANKVNIDGTTINASDVYKTLGGVAFAPQLVVYNLNADGEIRHIDTAAKAADNGDRTKDNMLIIEAEGSEQYDSLSNKLGKRMRVNANTLLFGTPASPKNADDSLFGVASATTKLVNEDTYNYLLYSYGTEQKEAADAIVVSNFYIGGSSVLSDKFIVTKLKKSLNSNDEVAVTAEGYHGINSKSFTFTKDITEQLLSEIHVGDVLSIGGMVGNDVGKYSIVLCPHEETQAGKYEKRPLVHTQGVNSAYSFVTAQNASLQSWAVRFITGYVSDVVGESVMVKYDRINANTTPTDFDVSSAFEWDELFITQGEPVFVINVDKENPNKTTVEKRSIADIKTYKATGEDCSRIFIYINRGDVRNFIVY